MFSNEQIDIACRKAGINPHSSFAIERFEVVKVSAGDLVGNGNNITWKEKNGNDE